MAKESPEIEIPGAEEIAELDAIAQGSIPNRNEVVSIYSKMLDRTVTVTRDQVYRYASVMSANNLIADLIGIDVNTLTANFKRELKMGRAFAKQKLMVRFYNLALYGNNPADRIFALKNWTAMSDQGLKEDLEDIEAGVEFKIKRPARAVERLTDIDARVEFHEKFQKDPESFEELKREST